MNCVGAHQEHVSRLEWAQRQDSNRSRMYHKPSVDTCASKRSVCHELNHNRTRTRNPSRMYHATSASGRPVAPVAPAQLATPVARARAVALAQSVADSQSVALARPVAPVARATHVAHRYARTELLRSALDLGSARSTSGRLESLSRWYCIFRHPSEQALHIQRPQARSPKRALCELWPLPPCTNIVPSTARYDSAASRMRSASPFVMFSLSMREATLFAKALCFAPKPRRVRVKT